MLVIVIAGDKGFAGGFNSNIGKAAQKFIDEAALRDGAERRSRTGRQEGNRALQEALSSRRSTSKTEQHYDNDLSTHYETIRHRSAPD